MSSLRPDSLTHNANKFSRKWLLSTLTVVRYKISNTDHAQKSNHLLLVQRTAIPHTLQKFIQNCLSNSAHRKTDGDRRVISLAEAVKTNQNWCKCFLTCLYRFHGAKCRMLHSLWTADKSARPLCKNKTELVIRNCTNSAAETMTHPATAQKLKPNASVKKYRPEIFEPKFQMGAST